MRWQEAWRVGAGIVGGELVCRTLGHLASST